MAIFEYFHLVPFTGYQGELVVPKQLSDPIFLRQYPVFDCDVLPTYESNSAGDWTASATVGMAPGGGDEPIPYPGFGTTELPNSVFIAEQAVTVR